MGVSMFRSGIISDVIVRDLVRYSDGRGWLTEIFRSDEIAAENLPAMGYVSVTRPGVTRGPHEHEAQSDFFGFLGPSTFKVYVWDNRQTSPTFMIRQVILAGEDHPCSVIIPPGVVHAYKNVGTGDGLVVNFPNRLFAGRGRKDPVDEIRHESDPTSIFLLD